MVLRYMKAEEERFLNLLYDYAYSTRSAEITSSEVDKKLLESLYVLIDTRVNLPKEFKLKILEEHNSERYRLHNSYSNKPRPNGIACPKCGSELLDSDPSTQLPSNPPQKNINCPSCDYIGYRIA